MAHHLTKVKVLRNTNYKASGPGSYVFMMQRYGKHGMKPTMPGPFQHTAQKVVKKSANGTEGEVYELSSCFVQIINEHTIRTHSNK